MHAVILTAGCSRRLRPLTNTTPKCLLSVGGQPILKRALKNLTWLGFEQFTVVTGFMAHKVRDAIASWFPALEVTYVHNDDYETTNNAYSLNLAGDVVAGREFALLDGDIIYDAEVVQALLNHGPDCLALRSSGSIGLEEVKVQVQNGTRVANIGKELAVPSAAGESVGIEYFSAETSTRLFDTLSQRVFREEHRNEYYEASFQVMIENGVAIEAVDIGDNYAIEIDTRHDLRAANEMLLARQSRTDKVAG